MPSDQPIYAPRPELQVSPHFFRTPIPGLFYVAYDVYPDERGFFSELVKAPEIEEVTGQKFVMAQTNLAVSQTNVIRGMHAEGWQKMVSVFQGLAFCSLADIRPTSPSFGQTVEFKLSAKPGEFAGGLFIPVGIANSVLALEGPVSYFYCVDRLYKERDPAGDVALSLFDPDLNINWPIPRAQMIISERDQNAVTMRQRFPDILK